MNEAVPTIAHKLRVRWRTIVLALVVTFICIASIFFIVFGDDILNYNRCLCDWFREPMGCHCRGPWYGPSEPGYASSPDGHYGAHASSFNGGVTVVVVDELRNERTFSYTYYHQADVIDYITYQNIFWNEDSTAFEVRYSTQLDSEPIYCSFRFEIPTEDFTLTCRSSSQ